MSLLLDTNFLLRLAQKSHPMHSEVRRALRQLRRSGENPYILHQNLVEFWAVATRPISANGLGLTIEETRKEVKLLKRLFQGCPETPEIFTEWEKLAVTYRVSGKATHDARIVAAMRVHGLNTLITYNTADFKRFTEITVVAPSDIK